MNYRDRIKALLGVATYRTRLVFFGVLGVLIFLVSFLVVDQVLREVLRGFSLTFMAVGAVDFVWDILGGDPLELQLTRDLGNIDAKLDNIHRSMAVLSDVVDANIGLERIWVNRRAWEQNSAAGLAFWKTLVCHARTVDIVSNTLWTRWFHDEEFRKQFFANIARGATVRILIYDPHSEVLKLRASDENDPGAGKQMRNEIESTLEVMARDRATLDDAAQKRIRVRLTNKHYHLMQIVRADEKMLVALYLTSKTGSSAPTFQLRGPETAYFSTYLEQIESLWLDGLEVSDDDIQQLLLPVHGAQN
jgi:hypothetical protein